MRPTILHKFTHAWGAFDTAVAVDATAAAPECMLSCCFPAEPCHHAEEGDIEEESGETAVQK